MLRVSILTLRVTVPISHFASFLSHPAHCDVILVLSTDGYRDNTDNLTLIPTGGVSSSNIGTTGNGESLVCFGELYSKRGVKAARKHIVSVHEKQLTLGIDRRSDVCATMLKSPGVTVIDMGSWNGDPR